MLQTAQAGNWSSSPAALTDARWVPGKSGDLCRPSGRGRDGLDDTQTAVGQALYWRSMSVVFMAFLRSDQVGAGTAAV